QTLATWNGTTGNWTNIALWNTPNYPNNDNPPGTTYDVLLNGAGTITLDVPITIQALDFRSGTITGSNNLTINALFTWSDGTLSGSGGTFANGGITITGGANKILDGRSLTMGGLSTWSQGAIFLNNGAGLTVAAGGTLETNTNYSI